MSAAAGNSHVAKILVALASASSPPTRSQTIPRSARQASSWRSTPSEGNGLSRPSKNQTARLSFCLGRTIPILRRGWRSGSRTSASPTSISSQTTSRQFYARACCFFAMSERLRCGEMDNSCWRATSIEVKARTSSSALGQAAKLSTGRSFALTPQMPLSVFTRRTQGWKRFIEAPS